MERTGYLLKAWYDGTISPAEEAELAAVLDSGKQEAAVHAALQSLWALHHGQEVFPAAVSEQLYQKIRPRQQVAPGVHFMRRFRWVAAAVFILIAGATGWFLLHQSTERAQITGSIYRNDIAPGKVGATLKLSDNRVIQLDSVADGVIAVEHGMKVIKRNGEIFYEGKAANSEAVIYNELIAAKKQRSSATLPDGSIAWVNASSSVRYPVHFSGSERKVTMTGEAIFRVAHNEKQPFRVYVRGQVFEDLGTEFNINAYEEEPVIRTTVLEGLVQTGSTRIAPGQQAQVAANGQVKLNTQVNTDEVFAWRDGQFSFSGADIEEIMKQTARWYDVEVEFTAKINQQFTIGLNRDKTLTEFLQALEQAGHVHFEVQGRKVTVKP